jgi:hypothetical protein
MWPLLLACTNPASNLDSADPIEPTYAWEADPIVPLPFTTVGEKPPDGVLTIRGTSRGEITIETDGDFGYVGDLAPLDGERALTVTWTGPIDAPINAVGVAHVTIDGLTADVALSAVIGDPALPAAAWTTDAWSTRATLELPSAAWPEHPSVLISVPPGLTDAGGVHVVTHFHGHNAVLERTVPAQAIVEQASLSGRDAVLIVPQGPYDEASGDFGQLMDDGGHERLVRDVIAVLYRDGFVTRPAPGLQVLTAHSGGYQATAAVVEGGGLPIAAVHLFDALYANFGTFGQYALDGGVLRSIYTCCGGTDHLNVALAAGLEDAGQPVGDALDDDALREGPVTIAYTGSTHNGCMSDDRYYARLLAASGLPRRPTAPIELRSVVAEGDQTVVTWLPDGEAVIEGSSDGSTWEELGRSDAGTLTVPAKPYVRVSGSDAYGSTGADWLVVDGFDRVLGGSWTAPTHDFAASVGHALGAPFSTCSDEAVARGEVGLSDFAHVLWLLGDESTADTTFDDAQQEAIADYVASGGSLVASGSEIGYATAGDWLSTVLRASYVADDAGTTELDDGTPFGVTYPEDYPDVLSGETVLLRYATGGAAAVGWDQRVVVVGFPLETLGDADRAAVIGDLTAWVE